MFVPRSRYIIIGRWGGHCALFQGDSHMESHRYQSGLERIREIFGEAGVKVIEAIAETSPDFARLTVEFPYGDIYSRPALGTKTREIVTLSSLITLGYALPELRVHMIGALRTGCTRGEILEIIMQVAVYAGFPAALNALQVARELFEELDGATPSV